MEYKNRGSYAKKGDLTAQERKELAGLQALVEMIEGRKRRGVRYVQK